MNLKQARYIRTIAREGDRTDIAGLLQVHRKIRLSFVYCH